MTAQTLRQEKGFTLIELLVVIGILAILLAITLIAINPARQFGLANDTNRRSAVTEVLNSLGQYEASNSGNFPPDIASMATNTPVALNSTNFPTLCGQLVPTYISALPVDPSQNNQAGINAAACGAAWDTHGYAILKDTQGRITVSATNPYLGPIQVTR